MIRYLSNPTLRPQHPILAIDLGYSAKAKSCGMAWSGADSPIEVTFGDCIQKSVELINQLGDPVLVLEAVLSRYHSPDGNPALRGSFEKGRGWYHGPGVTTLAAALEFLEQVDSRLPNDVRLPLFEGLLSFKKTKTAHSSDAQYMIEQFLTVTTVTPPSGSRPLLACMDGAPQIKLYSSAPETLKGETTKEIKRSI